MSVRLKSLLEIALQVPQSILRCGDGLIHGRIDMMMLMCQNYKPGERVTGRDSDRLCIRSVDNKKKYFGRFSTIYELKLC